MKLFYQKYQQKRFDIKLLALYENPFFYRKYILEHKKNIILRRQIN